MLTTNLRQRQAAIRQRCLNSEDNLTHIGVTSRDVGDHHSPPVFVSGNIKISSITLQNSEQQTRRYSRSLGQ